MNEIDIGALVRDAGRMTATKRSRFWSEEEDARLRELLDTHTYAQAGERLGRSEAAVKIRTKHQGIQPPSKRPGWLTAHQAMNILRKDSHVATSFERHGIMKFEYVPFNRTGRRIRRIRTVTFRRWVVNPLNWIYFDWRKVKDPSLRRMCALVEEHWGDQWLTTGQAARYMREAGREDCTHQLINHGIHRLNLPSVKWGNHYILRSSLENFWIDIGQGKSGQYKVTLAHDAALLTLSAVGLFDRAVARLMEGRKSYKSLVYCRRQLNLRGEIPDVIGKFSLPIGYAPTSGQPELWASWRECGLSLPYVAHLKERIEKGLERDRVSKRQWARIERRRRRYEREGGYLDRDP